VGRFGEWEMDTAGRTCRSAGLQTAFAEVLHFASLLPCWTWAQKCRLLTVGGHTSGGKLLEGIGTWAKENPPQESPGRALAVFKIFSPSPR
jgi:hypothetical protein